MCVPTARSDVVNVAWPWALRATLGEGTASSVNVTVPAVTAPRPVVTVAVKVTAWPTNDGLPEETRVVVVVAGSTSCASDALLPWKFAVPL